MKTMKRIFACVATVAMAATLSFSAFAANLDANKQKVLDAVSQSITVDGKKVELPAEYKTQAENYLKRDDVEITADQADAIVGQVDAAIEVVKEYGVTDLAKLSSADKAKIADKVQAAAAVVELKVVFDSAKNTITITDKDNKVVATMEAPVKTTGANAGAAVAVLGFAAVLLAGCAVVAKKSQLAAK